MHTMKRSSFAGRRFGNQETKREQTYFLTMMTTNVMWECFSIFSNLYICWHIHKVSLQTIPAAEFHCCHWMYWMRFQVFVRKLFWE